MDNIETVNKLEAWLADLMFLYAEPFVDEQNRSADENPQTDGWEGWEVLRARVKEGLPSLLSANEAATLGRTLDDASETMDTLRMVRGIGRHASCGKEMRQAGLVHRCRYWFVSNPENPSEHEVASLARQKLGEYRDAVRKQIDAINAPDGPRSGASLFGDGVPSDPPVGAFFLDENDIALLVFLSRTPRIRRKISDVVPAIGPQNRGAIGKRLRKLAELSPALVDYPKDGRGGVAISVAGVEAIRQAQLK